MTQHHLIFGTGPLGISTAKTLLENGQRVTLVNRSGNRQGIPKPAALLQGDASQAAEAHRLSAGADVIYQCAQPAYQRWAEEFPALQDSILEAAASHKANLVIADNLYMYGPPNGQALREDHAYTPTTKKGKVRAQMAQDALEAHRNGRLNVALVRGSNFFGPHDQIMLNLIFKPALENRSLQLMGRTDQPHSFTYAPDFGRALATIGMSSDGWGRAWHTPSNPAITQAELLGLLEVALGQPVKRLVAGATLLRLLGFFNPLAKESLEMLYEWQQPFVMDSSEFSARYGWQATPLETAVRETLEWAKTTLKRAA